MLLFRRRFHFGSVEPFRVEFDTRLLAVAHRQVRGGRDDGVGHGHFAVAARQALAVRAGIVFRVAELWIPRAHAEGEIFHLFPVAAANRARAAAGRAGAAAGSGAGSRAPGAATFEGRLLAIARSHGHGRGFRITALLGRVALVVEKDLLLCFHDHRATGAHYALAVLLKA